MHYDLIMEPPISDKLRYDNEKVSLDRVIADAPFGLITVDHDGTIILINRQTIELLMLKGNLAKVHGSNILNWIGHIPPLYDIMKKNLETGPVPFYFKSIRISRKHLAIRGIQAGKNYMVVIQNITQVKETEVEVLSAMIEGQEKERKKIAREIHDGIGPLLSAIRINLEALKARGNLQMDKKSLDDMDQIILTLDETTQDIRAMSHNLMPPVLIDFGLIPAVNNLCSRIRNSGKVEIELITNLNKRIESENELILYRIVQELVNNSLKHSEASKITVQIMDHGSHILLSVEDNGKGFNLEEVDAHSTGTGLSNIQARIQARQGSIHFDTKPGMGFIAHIEIPVSE
jgi:signal transduction histidine kinase